jgi:hypothetical protein
LLLERLTGIDETNRGQHHYLEEDDGCWYLGEYFAGKGYQGGGTNQLIFNLKMKPSIARQNPARGRYKEDAINDVATALTRILVPVDRVLWTWVPVPTSKCVGHPDYDDRLHRILATAFQRDQADVRQLLRQTQSTEADHAAQSRLTPEALEAVLEVDQAALTQRPIRERGIVLFDDVLTTGKHFKCCQRMLRQVVAPDTRIIGVFVARRVLANVSDPSVFAPIPDDGGN